MIENTGLLARFVLPLCPTANHGYANSYHGGKHKTPALTQWEEEVALIVGDYRPSRHMSLRVTMTVALPKNLYRKADIDGYSKFPIDRTIGSRTDCWVDELHSFKRLDAHGKGSVTIEIEEVPARIPAEVFPPGDFIREEIAERGWSVDTFSQESGIPISTIWMLLSAERRITRKTASGLAKAFGTGADFWVNLERTYRNHPTIKGVRKAPVD